MGLVAAFGAASVALARCAPQRVRHLSHKRPRNVRCVVLTGGPCAGKTLAVKHITEEMARHGVHVHATPETPTIIMSSGFRYPGVDSGERLLEFELALVKLQLQMEDSFLRIAAANAEPAVVLMDRGVLDIAAYMRRADWLEVLRRAGVTEEQLLDRYDMVLHLVTAADGAEKHYTLENNQARKETPEQARELDRRVMEVWSQHKVRRVVDNSTDFHTKLQRVTLHVMEASQSLHPHAVTQKTSGAGGKVGHA